LAVPLVVNEESTGTFLHSELDCYQLTCQANNVSFYLLNSFVKLRSKLDYFNNFWLTDNRNEFATKIIITLHCETRLCQSVRSHSTITMKVIPG